MTKKNNRVKRYPFTSDLNIGVWECQFYLTDDDGNEVLDEDGCVQIYNAPDLDWSHIAEYVEIEDLKEVEND